MIRQFTQEEKEKSAVKFKNAYSIIQNHITDRNSLIEINAAYRLEFAIIFSENLLFRMIQEDLKNKTFSSTIPKFQHLSFKTVKEVELLHSLSQLRPDLDCNKILELFKMNLAVLGVESEWNDFK